MPVIGCVRSALSAALVILAAGQASATVRRVYVDAAAAPGGNGASWESAFVDLQPALDAIADPNAPAMEIWVARGIYTPTAFPPSRGGDPRLRTFSVPPLPGPVTIYGGLEPGANDPTGAGLFGVSTLSGDFNRDDQPGFINNDENAYHVLTTAFDTFGPTLTLKGFLITGGNANGELDDTAAGILARSPLHLVQSYIYSNRAAFNGAGVYALSSLTVDACRFDGNVANRGGGIYFQDVSAADGSRGFIPALVARSSEIVNNNGAFGGGGLYLSAFANATITNCTIASNSSSTNGAGLFWDNGGSAFTTVVVQNSVFWNNVGDAGNSEDNQVYPLVASAGAPVVRYTTVQNLFQLQGVALSSANPRFRALQLGDYRPAVDSPSIDSGDTNADTDAVTPGVQPLPTFDAVGGFRVQDGNHTGTPVVDRGAQEVAYSEVVRFIGNPSGGPDYSTWSDPSAWYGDAVPRSFDLTSFDAYANNLIRLSQNQAARVIYSQSTNTAFDLAGNNLSLSSGVLSFGVGALKFEALSRGVNNVTAPYTYVGPNDGDNATLTVGQNTNYSTTVLTTVGGRGVGTLNVDGGAYSTNDLVIGEQNTGIGSVNIGGTSGSGAFSLNTPNADWTIGHSGMAVVNVSGVASLNATFGGGLNSLTFGNNPGSLAYLDVDGSKASAQFASTDATIGNDGYAQIRTFNGASIGTDLESPLVFGRGSGGYGIAILDAGYSGQIVWDNTSPGVLIGGEGTATLVLDSGAVFASHSPGRGGILTHEITIAPRSVLSGVGSIETSGLVRNNGAVAPGRLHYIPGATIAPPDLGALTIAGDYIQERLPGQTVLDSGALRIRVGGQDLSDALAVQGTATLGGALYVERVFNFDPAEGANYPVVIAASRLGAFNVSYLPGFTDARYYAVEYSGGEARLAVRNASTVQGFTPPGVYSAPGEPVAGVLADFTGDGLPDLAVTVPNLNPAEPGWVAVYLNLGNNAEGEWRGFGQPTSYAVGRNPRAIAAGNFGGGPAIDLAVVNTDDNTVQYLANLGSGVFNVQAPFDSIAIAPVAITAGKFGSPAQAFDDIAVSGQETTDPNGPGLVQIFSNNSVADGFFPPPTPGPNLHPRRPVTAIQSGDADNDKDIDIIGTSPTSSNAVIAPNNGNGGFLTPVTVPTGAQPEDVGAGMLQHANGGPTAGTANIGLDIVTANRAAGTVSVILFNGLDMDGKPTYLPAIEIPVGPQARSLALADVDGDGDLDILVVITDPQEGPVVRYLQNQFAQTGQLQFSLIASLFQTFGPNRVLAGDLTGNGRNDIVTLNTNTTSVPGQQAVTVSISSPRSSSIMGDLNNDGRVDMLDLNIVLSQFGQTGAALAGDANFDNWVSFNDLNIVLGYYGFPNNPAIARPPAAYRPATVTVGDTTLITHDHPAPR